MTKQIELTNDEAQVLRELRKRKGKLITIKQIFLSVCSKSRLYKPTISKALRSLIKLGLAGRAFVRSSDGYYAYRATQDYKHPKISETVKQIQELDT